ncbi:MAG: protein kinase [Planctomycetota bacterium]|jgi:serine/threonine protein kinase|nr:protein kinase [Planctomycetota bacterium]
MARLEMRRDNRTQEFELGAVTTLGRKADCAIGVPSLRASREHCRVTQRADRFFLEDLGSANGTFVNGERVVNVELCDRDEIVIGGVAFRFLAQSSDPLVGKPFHADYFIREKIGGGGMGTVYLAEQKLLAGEVRPVAVKILNPPLATNPDFVEAFAREALISSKLSHPNLITLYEFRKKDGCFFSMEFVDGENLLDSILRQGALAVDAVLDYGRQAAAALDYLHRHGVIHKDFKPRNLLIKRNGLVKLADMGLAAFITPPSDGAGADAAGAAGAAHPLPVMATPQYVAPEIIRRQPADPRSDLYSFAATLYHALTARVPYDAKRVGDLLKLHLYAPVPDPRVYRPKIPAELAQFIMRGLAKNPADRPQTAAEYGEFLQKMQTNSVAAEKKLDTAFRSISQTVKIGAATPDPASGTEVFAEDAEPPLHTTLRQRRSKFRPVLLGGALVALLAAAGYYLWQNQELLAETAAQIRAKITAASAPPLPLGLTPAENLAAPAPAKKNEPAANPVAENKMPAADAAAMQTADGFYGGGRFNDALKIYTALSETHSPSSARAAARAADIWQTQKEIVDTAWRDLGDHLRREDFIAAQETANRLTEALADYPQAGTGADFLALANAAEKFSATAATVQETLGAAPVLVFVDGRMRKARLEIRDGQLFAVGKNNAEIVRLAQVNAEDVLGAWRAAAATAAEIPVLALGGMVMAASADEPFFAAYQTVAQTGDAATRRQAEMAGSLAAGSE